MEEENKNEETKENNNSNNYKQNENKKNDVNQVIKIIYINNCILFYSRKNTIQF